MGVGVRQKERQDFLNVSRGDGLGRFPKRKRFFSGYFRLIFFAKVRAIKFCYHCMRTSGFWNTIDGCFHIYMKGGRCCCPRYEQNCGQRWKAEGGGAEGGKGGVGGKGGCHKMEQVISKFFLK